ncbi:MAG: hypothetical protein K2L05_05370 [Muribaculaceae bacterium]|nr:hypothetical protein [Muribaculaceae bacterium]
MITQSAPANELTPLEQAVLTEPRKRTITFGLPSGLEHGERRFALTPEGAARLTDCGIAVKIQRGAGEPIHYSDAAYERAGATLCSRAEALQAEVVISTAALSAGEAATLRRGTLLLTLLQPVVGNPLAAKALLRAGVNVVAADLINTDGHRLIADILHEIDGCASMAIASAMLTDPIHGKGILLGGVTGIVPCEVTVIGSGMGAIAAAHNALGAGATVRMFDNDLYSLRSAGRVLDHRCIASALHPKVLRSALRSADVVVVTPMRTPTVVDSDIADEMKKRVLIFDLTSTPGATFPSIPVIDLSAPSVSTLAAGDARACYCNVGNRVPRTAAMALSNALVGNADALRQTLGSLADLPRPMRPAMLTYWGKCVNPRLAEALGIRALDINLLTGN